MLHFSGFWPDLPNIENSFLIVKILTLTFILFLKQGIRLKGILFFRVGEGPSNLF